MMPKFGMLTDPVLSVPDEIIRFKKLGFDYAEIGIEEPLADSIDLSPSKKTNFGVTVSQRNVCHRP